MIQIQELSKNFDGFQALDRMNLSVKKGSIYGLVGVNGSGKTTIIKHLTGIYRQDSGSVQIDSLDVYDNAEIKKRVGYISDDLYFFPGYSIQAYADFYKDLYKTWNNDRYNELLKILNLNNRQKLSRFSKGMQKQAAFIFALSILPDVLILDEPIDGLDPLVRKHILQFIVNDVAERDMTVLISSHNLKEMEGICDSIGIVRSGRMAIERDLDDLKSDVHKVQVAYPEKIQLGREKYDGLNILHLETRGSVEIFVVRGKEEEIRQRIQAFEPLLCDILPLSLEEIFIYEMEGDSDELPV